MLVFDNDIEASYRILVSRGNQRRLADLYLFNLPDMIPQFPLPLRAGDAEPIVDLQGLLNGVYAPPMTLELITPPHPELRCRKLMLLGRMFFCGRGDRSDDRGMFKCDGSHILQDVS